MSPCRLCTHVYYMPLYFATAGRLLTLQKKCAFLNATLRNPTHADQEIRSRS